MSVIFETKDSVFFVGGRGTKVGNANAGGCTQDFWDTSQDLADVMKDNGVVQGWNDGAIITDNGSGKVRITSDENDFVTCSIGLVAYIDFDAVYPDGRYEVIDIEAGGEWVDIDLDWSANTACTIWIGGAFDTAQNAWDNTDATQGYNVTIYSNKSQSKTNGDFIATWNLGTAGGSLANKSFKRFAGFNLLPGDGGQIVFDGEDDGAFDPDGGIRFNLAIENVIFENVIVKNAHYGWNSINNTVSNMRFIKCEGNSGAETGWYLGYGKSFVLIDCQGNHNTVRGFDTAYISGIPNHLLINCIAHDNTRDGFYRIGGNGGSILLGCIAYDNGDSGFRTNSYSGSGAMINCVAYNNGKHGFELWRGNPITINCIAKDNGQWGFYADLTNPLMAPHVSYCCAHGNTSGQYSLIGALPEQNSIEEDPQFVDAAGGDFRLKPTSPCLNTGQRTIGSDSADGYSTIGAWQRISYLLGMK